MSVRPGSQLSRINGVSFIKAKQYDDEDIPET